MKSSIPNAYVFSRKMPFARHLVLRLFACSHTFSMLRGLISRAPTGKSICIRYIPKSAFLVSHSKYFLIVFCLSLLSSFNSIAHAAEKASKPIGVVLAASGEVSVVRTKETFSLKRSERLFSGDRIITAINSRVQLKFVDRSIIALKQDSELSIDEFVFDTQTHKERSFYTLVRGGFRAVSGKIGKTDPADYAIKTPIATLGIRGTFYDAVLSDKLYVGVMSGKVAVGNTEGELLVGVDAPFQFAAVGANQAPQGLLETPDALSSANAEFDPDKTLETEKNSAAQTQTKEEASTEEQAEETDATESENTETTQADGETSTDAKASNTTSTESTASKESTTSDVKNTSTTSTTSTTTLSTDTKAVTQTSNAVSTTGSTSSITTASTSTNTSSTTTTMPSVEKNTIQTFTNPGSTSTTNLTSPTNTVLTTTTNVVQQTTVNTVVQNNQTVLAPTFNSLFNRAADSKTQGIVVRQTAGVAGLPVIFSGQAIDPLGGPTFNLADRGQEWTAGTNTFALLNFSNTAQFTTNTISVNPQANLLLGTEFSKYKFGAMNQIGAVFNDLNQVTPLNAVHHFIAGPTLGSNWLPVDGTYIYSVDVLHTAVPHAPINLGPEFNSHSGQDIMIDTRTGSIELDMQWQQFDPTTNTTYHWNIDQQAMLVDGSVRFVWDETDNRTDGLTRQACNSSGCTLEIMSGKLHIQLAGSNAQTALGGFWFDDGSASGFSGVFAQRQDDRWSFLGMNTACADFDNCTQDGFAVLSQNPTWLDLDGTALPNKRLLRGSTFSNGVDEKIHFYADEVGKYGAAVSGTTLASERFTKSLLGVNIQWGKWSTPLEARLNPANPLLVRDTGTLGLWINGPKTDNDWFNNNYQTTPSITHLSYAGPMLAGRLGSQQLDLTKPNNINLTINLMSASWYGNMELATATQQLNAQLVGSVQQADLIGIGNFVVRENALPTIDTHTGNLHLEAFLVGDNVEGLIGGFTGTANPIAIGSGFNLEGIFAVPKSSTSNYIGGTLNFTGARIATLAPLIMQSTPTQNKTPIGTPQPGNVEWGSWSSTAINAKFQPLDPSVSTQSADTKFWIFGTPTRSDYFNQAMSQGVTSLEYQGTAKLGLIGNQNITSSNFNMRIDLPSAKWSGQGNFNAPSYQATVTVPTGAGIFTPVLSQFSAPSAQLNILNTTTSINSTGNASWQGQVVGPQGEAVIGGITGKAGTITPINIQTVIQGSRVMP